MNNGENKNENEKTFNFDGTRIEVENVGHGHTDGDVWIYFKKADVLALGDTFWNGIYPYIDNEDGGDIDGAIEWANKAVAFTTDHTIVIPGHGAAGTRAQLIEFRDMLVTVRDNVAALKKQGKSLDEIVAARPRPRLTPNGGISCSTATSSQRWCTPVCNKP